MKFRIVYSEAAKEDIMELTDFISFSCKAPKTSKDYMKALFNKIKSLSDSADSFPLYNRKSFIQYGFNVRRINYKKIIIIYTLHGNLVLIHRIISGSLIAEIE